MTAYKFIEIHEDNCRISVDYKPFIFNNVEEAKDMYKILSDKMRENALLSSEIDSLKGELTRTKVSLSHMEDKYAGLLKLVHGCEEKND